MIKELKFHFLFLLALSVCIQTLATPWKKIEKEKVIEANHTLSKKGRIEIENKYGEVTIKTWDKDEVTLKATIRAWSGSESRAEGILEDITVTHRKSGNTVSIKTIVSSRNNGSNYNQGFEINYEISMPAQAYLELSNRFGAVSLEDHAGGLELEVEHGNLRTGHLTGAEKKYVRVRFGQVDIDEFSAGEMNVQHGNCTVKTVGNAFLDVRHGSLQVEEGRDLETEVQHGSTTIGTVNSLEAESGFGRFSVERVETSIRAEIKHGSCDIDEMGANFKAVYIESSHGSVDVGTGDSKGFMLNAKSQFGSIRSSLSGLNFSRDIKENSSHRVEGKYGNGAGRIEIKSSHGSIRIR